MIKSERYTSKFLNKEKFEFLLEVDNHVKELKNYMSEFCYEHLFDLINNSNFSAHYKSFKGDYLDAWETQTLFSDVIKFYINQYKQKIRNIDFKTQKSFKVTHYVKGVKKGRIKTKSIQFNKISNLGKLIKYLCYLENPKDVQNAEIKDLYDYYKAKGFEDRILYLVKAVQNRIKKRIKLIEFTTGTHRKAFNYCGNKDKNGEITQKNGFLFDDSNTLYKHWFKYKVSNKVIYLPIQINEKYHNFHQIKKGQFFVKINKKKVDIIGTKEVDDLNFKKLGEVLGVDLNVKHNFLFCSNNQEFDYDRKYVKQFAKELKKFDKIGLKNISDGQKKRLEKLVRVNEWYFKKLISEILDDFEKQNITDIVMEDLSNFGKTFIKSEEFEVKYSRLVRLLRLNSISTWLFSQAEKRGIRVHLTSPCYTSQMCDQCGFIDSGNRKTQEEFECLECGNQLNADYNASLNIKNRLTVDVLRSKLHNFDEFQRLIPKKLKKELIKEILEDYATNNTGLNCTFNQINN